MTRTIRGVLALLVALGLLLVPTAASAARPGDALLPPVPGCQERTSTQSDPGPWRYNYLEDWWVAGSYRISANCAGHNVTAYSDGWRFEGSECGQMWVRRQRSDGTTYILPGSVKHVCGGQTVVLASSQPVNARIWIEAWQYDAADRRPGLWWVGTIRF